MAETTLSTHSEESLEDMSSDNISKIIITIMNVQNDYSSLVMKSTPKFKAIPFYSEKRLPTPCPLSTFTPLVQQGIENNKFKGNLKTRMLRESANHYYGLCPHPTP